MTSTTSFAAATCSIVSEGIIGSIFRSFAPSSDAKFSRHPHAFQPMKILSILGLVATFAMLETGYSRDVIHKGDVVVVPLRGEISPSLLMFLRRAEKLAETNAASAIIFEMNTYGARTDAAEEITSFLHHDQNPT